MDDILKSSFDELGISTSENTPDNDVELYGDNVHKAIIDGCEVTVVDKLEKAMLFSDLSSESGQFAIEKTGKLLKPKLELLKTSAEAKIKPLQDKMTEALKELDVKPDEEYKEDDWVFDGMGSLLAGEKFKTFSYDLMYQNKEVRNSPAIIAIPYSSSMDDGGTKKDDLDEQGKIRARTKCMQEYNTAVRQIINYKIEVLKLNTIINNINDSKTYKLSARQATVLGF